MGLHDGAAQGQAQAQAPPSVAPGVVGCVKHVEQLGLGLVRDAGAVVGDAHLHALSPLPGGHLDMGAGGRVFDGVVDDVDDHLHDQKIKV